jgi:hypothetical protein
VPAVAAATLALLLLFVGEGPAERLDPPLAGDDEEDVARLRLEEAQVVFGVPVAVQLALEPLLGLGAAVPLQPALNRAPSGVEDEAGVRAQPLGVEQLGRVAASPT